jgi:hypothetical protein
MPSQRSEFAVGFRNERSSDGVWLACPFPESTRQFAKPPLDAIRRDVPEVPAICPGVTLFGATLRLGVCQKVFTALILFYSEQSDTGFCLQAID